MSETFLYFHSSIPDARDAQNPDPSWQEACAVTTRSQAKKKDERTAFKVPSSRESPIVDREKLKQTQREDESLRKYWDRVDASQLDQDLTQYLTA